MRVVIFGASGRTGRRVAETVVARGMDTVAVVRVARPAAPFDPLVRVEQRNLDNDETIGDLLTDTSGVVCAFGPHPPFTEHFCGSLTQRIIRAMVDVGARRLVCVTGAMASGPSPKVSAPMRRMAAMFERRYLNLVNDRRRQEQAVTESELEWTVIKPPRLTDGLATGNARIGSDVRVGLMSSVSRADLAFAIVSMLENGLHVREAVYIRS